MTKTVLRTFTYSFTATLLALFIVCHFYKQSTVRSNGQTVKFEDIKISLFTQTDEQSKKESLEEIIKITKEEVSDDDLFNWTAMYYETLEQIALLEKENSNMTDGDNLAIYYDEDDNVEIVQNISTTYTEDNIKEENISIDNLVHIANIVEKDIMNTINIALSEEQLTFPTYENLESNEEQKNQVTEVDGLDFSLPIQRSSSRQNGKKNLILNAKTTNQVAMSESSIAVQSIIMEEEQTTPSSLEQESSPWVVAKGARFPNNSMILQENQNDPDSEEKTSEIKPEEQTPSEIKTSKIVRNILIPIPEEILQEENMTPQLMSSEKNKDLQKKLNISDIKNESNITRESGYVSKSNTDKERKKTDKKDKKTIFESISSIFSGKTPEIGVSKIDKKTDTRNSVYVGKKTKDKSREDSRILPTEIKLSFQPNRAEISGQTLRWIEAFAKKTMEEDDVVLEIRIDGSGSFELQHRRLGLLHNILANRGVDYNKINTVFTSREPNSFIIRTVRISNNAVAESNNRNANDIANYYKNW